MHNVLIISYIAFSIGNLFILPESLSKSGLSCHGKALPLLADVEKAGMRAAARAK